MSKIHHVPLKPKITCNREEALVQTKKIVSKVIDKIVQKQQVLYVEIRLKMLISKLKKL